MLEESSKERGRGVGGRCKREAKEGVEVWTYVEVLEKQKQGICYKVRCWG